VTVSDSQPSPGLLVSVNWGPPDTHRPEICLQADSFQLRLLRHQEDEYRLCALLGACGRCIPASTSFGTRRATTRHLCLASSVQTADSSASDRGNETDLEHASASHTLPGVPEFAASVTCCTSRTASELRRPSLEKLVAHAITVFCKLLYQGGLAFRCTASPNIPPTYWTKTGVGLHASRAIARTPHLNSSVDGGRAKSVEYSVGCTWESHALARSDLLDLQPCTVSRHQMYTACSGRLPEFTPPTFVALTCRARNTAGALGKRGRPEPSTFRTPNHDLRVLRYVPDSIATLGQ